MRAIDADALKEDLTRFYDNEVTARKLIDEQPTIQPKKGRWEQKDFKYHCSCCDGIAPKAIRWDFCPNCGADMRGEKDG